MHCRAAQLGKSPLKKRSVHLGRLFIVLMAPQSKYDAVFAQLEPDPDGKISGKKAKKVLFSRLSAVLIVFPGVHAVQVAQHGTGQNLGTLRH